MKEFKTITELDILRYARRVIEDKEDQVEAALNKAFYAEEIDELQEQATMWHDKAAELSERIREILTNKEV